MRLYPKFAVLPAFYDPTSGMWIVDVYGKTDYSIEEEGYSKTFITTLDNKVHKRVRGYRFRIEIKNPQIKTVETVRRLAGNPIRVALLGAIVDEKGIPMLNIPEQYWVQEASDNRIKLVSNELMEDIPPTYMFAAFYNFMGDEVLQSKVIFVNFLGSFDATSSYYTIKNAPPFYVYVKNTTTPMEPHLVNIKTLKINLSQDFAIDRAILPLDVFLPEIDKDNLSERFDIPKRLEF